MTSDEALTAFSTGGEIEFEVPDTSSLGIGGWTCRLSRGSSLTEFQLTPHGAADIFLHGEVDTDELAIAVTCIHRGLERSLVVQSSADLRSTKEWEPTYPQAAELAARLRSALDAAPVRPAPLTPRFDVPIRPGDPEWDAYLVDRVAMARQRLIWPEADQNRSFLIEGRDYIAALGPRDRLEFMFSVPGPWDHREAWGPWWIGVHDRDVGEAHTTSSFLGGAMGADDTYGWVVWHTPDLYYCMYDHAGDRRMVLRLPKPREMAGRSPADAAWWLALACALQYAHAEDAGEILFER